MPALSSKFGHIENCVDVSQFVVAHPDPNDAVAFLDWKGFDISAFRCVCLPWYSNTLALGTKGHTVVSTLDRIPNTLAL